MLNLFQFENKNMEPEERLLSWREYTNPVADLNIDVEPDNQGICCLKGWELENIVIVREANSGGQFARRSSRARNTVLDHFYLHIPCTGESYVTSYLRGKLRRSRSKTNIATLHSMADVMEGRMAGVDSIMLFMPRAQFGQAAEAMDKHTNLNMDDTVGRILVEYIRIITTHLEKEDVAGFDAVTHSLIELVKSHFGSTNYRPQGVDPSIVKVVAKSRVRNYINSNLRNPDMSIDLICRAIGLSRATLYRLFEPEGGVARYVMQQRLQIVMKELSTQHHIRPLSEIATMSGFRDARTLLRALNRHLGTPASDIAPVKTRKSPYPQSTLGSALYHIAR